MRKKITKHIDVAVYGTLKRGYGGFDCYLQDADFLGEGVTTESFVLVDLGAFPGLVKSHPEYPKRPVRVEVFRVDTDTLRALDAYEGVPHLYHRKRITVRLFDTVELSTWVYILNDPDGYPACGIDERGNYIWR